MSRSERKALLLAQAKTQIKIFTVIFALKSYDKETVEFSLQGSSILLTVLSNS